MRSFVVVMGVLLAGLFASVAFFGEPERPADPVSRDAKPPTSPQDHKGSPAYWRADVSRGNDSDVVICDHTANSDRAAIIFRAGGDNYSGVDSNGPRSGCSHYGVPGRLAWHLTCRDIGQAWWYPGARCSGASYH